MTKRRKTKSVQAPKPINMAIQFGVPEGSKATNLSIRADGSIIITDATGAEIVPEYMERRVFYDRAAKEKVQSRWQVKSGHVTVSGIPELARYESLFAIDTATRDFNGERTSVACFFAFHLSPDGDKFRVVTEAALSIYEFRGAIENPEMLAILKVANDVAATPSLAKAHRFAIVTDSELGSHDEMNARTRPIHGQHYLPSQFTLAYAGSDTGREFLKKLILFCDRQADFYFGELQRGAIQDKAFQLLPEDPAVRYRFYRRKGLEVVNPIVSGPRIAPGT